jgi:hypothetical protein
MLMCEVKRVQEAWPKFDARGLPYCLQIFRKSV